jgi:hypothetical protein
MAKKKNKELSLFAFDCSAQGASHIKEDKVCQDFAASKYGERYAVAVVADGHGSSSHFRSDVGSRLAVETAMNAIHAFMHECAAKSKVNKWKNNIERIKADPDKFLRQLENNILYEWNRKVEHDFREHPFTEDELSKLNDADRQRVEHPDYRVKVYGTTLIAVVVYPPYFWFGFHIGDGKCVAMYDDGAFEQPIPWDDKCFLNVTTSMCDRNAVENFRHCFRPDKNALAEPVRFPVGLFVGTDGVDDSFGDDDRLHGFYRELMRQFRENGSQKAVQEIQSSLPIISARGSQDDISVAGIIFK